MCSPTTISPPFCDMTLLVGKIGSGELPLTKLKIFTKPFGFIGYLHIGMAEHKLNYKTLNRADTIAT